MTAKSRSTAPRSVEPAPATKHTEPTSYRACRIFNNSIRLAFVIILITIPVTTPLMSITMHIVQTPRIRRKTTYGNRILSVNPLWIIVVWIVSIIVCVIRRQVFTRIKEVLMFLLGRHTPTQLPLANDTSSPTFPTSIRNRLLRHSN